MKIYRKLTTLVLLTFYLTDVIKCMTLPNENHHFTDNNIGKSASITHLLNKSWIESKSGDHRIESDTRKPGELWAVLVAGSNGWFNYRHQADVCHAYQILHKNGVPDDHIIVMMFDDISNSTENPTPGIIVNQPNGTNVYNGVLKDYTGEDVTPQNFLNVLKGNASAMRGVGSGKVVQSTHRDRIFINLVDHGAPGLFGFPNKVLHSRSLIKTIVHLHRKKKFREMVIYLESCESGSMFKDLIPDDIKVYAVTASKSHESSYACYWDKERSTYLGDVFSVKWMEDTDRENIHKERLKDQFHLVRKEVTTSRVMEWGERDINKQRLWEFMGERDHIHEDKKDESVYHPNETNIRNSGEKLKEGKEINYKMDDITDPCISSAVASPDVPLAILEQRKSKSNDDEKHMRQITTLHMTRLLVHVITRTLVKEITKGDNNVTQLILNITQDITKWDCYERTVDIFHMKCFNLGKNPYALRVMQILVNICEHGYTSAQFLEAANTICVHIPFTGIV